ncbi:PepSY-associated TM helix domain-containing protein [Mucilaginibacter aquatilis]|uniref:PepSY domain-containing protein n=1 Tax=Mucilaginibacter aquatilis TaxID=1517760 RepID=A0A6I4I952_9SPHI|nr:PepSY-associated TM helix domain-containing protein [Mucilaginibacter aquatilis]MVN91785.1 PepSY domain-containing protein [Mucilaginibacter aquatilis]
MMTANKSINAKKHKDSVFKRINNWLHLWLGLISGIIVFIVCVNACIWVFNEEITGLLEPQTKVEWQDKPVLKPSELTEIASRLYPGKVPSYANYQQGRAINLSLRLADAKPKERRSGNTVLKINPYTGEVLAREEHKKGETDFFRFILNGHRFLWLPVEIGRPVVNYATLIFVVILITGLIWWYPKKWNKTTREKSFTIKWNASFKRLNLDLHNVLGFYAMIFLACIALTGMVYGIKWYSESVYWVTSGGEKLAEYKRMQSDSLQQGKFYTTGQAMDLAWSKVISRHPKSMGFYYSFADASQPKAAIDITVYPNRGQFYNSRGYSFDQHTLKEFIREDAYSVPYEQASFGQKLRKMNYDIHVGSILGFPGKVLAFFASLIGASLPVTGFLVWYNRKFKKKGDKKPKRKSSSEMQERNFKPSHTSKVSEAMLASSSTSL